MTFDRTTSYSALLSRDPRFDGRIFVGIETTGIYCRPICPSRRPRMENCRFFPSAAAAEREGFRPCLRCRPEEAPGNASIDGVTRLAVIAAHKIETEESSDLSLELLARHLGVSDRHLRRAFSRTFGVSPIHYAQTKKLQLARQLIKGNALSVLDVAMAAGFGSVRQLNALFRDRYRTTPTEMRRSSGMPFSEPLVFKLGFRPPYAWEAILEFLAARSLKGVEEVANHIYRRSASIQSGGRRHFGWLTVSLSNEKNALQVQLSPSLLPVLPQVLGRLRFLFDTGCNPDAVRIALGPLWTREPGLRLPGCFDGFEIAVLAVLGQQISMSDARILAGRLIEASGTPVRTPFSEIIRAFPIAEDLAMLPLSALARLGIPDSKARTILALSNAYSRGAIALNPVPDVEKEILALRSISGIEEWTAGYITMRTLNWPDAFPHPDRGIEKALNERSPRRILEIANRWRPWRAYAAMALWRSMTELQ